jgi:serine/threonine protein phosphatase 1
MYKTYAFSDVHGIYDLWAQIRDYCDETDTIYFLGDACDRGEDGIRIIIELLQDKRVKYIKGNHEDMLTYLRTRIY